MKKIVLIRHGQSQYNLENRFTGWYDCPLSGHGVSEAKKAAHLLKENDFLFDEAYTSLLKRAIDTLNIILSELNQEWIPVAPERKTLRRFAGPEQKRNGRKIRGRTSTIVAARLCCAPRSA